MQRTSSKNGFALALFGATNAWYFSTLLAYIFEKYHSTIIPNATWYNIYWSAFYDGFQQHLFYILFIIQAVIFGFAFRLIPPIPDAKIKSIVLGSTVAILLIPLAAMGAYGISLAPEWPTLAPPHKVFRGVLWCLPGFAALIYTMQQMFSADTQVKIK